MIPTGGRQACLVVSDKSQRTGALEEKLLILRTHQAVEHAFETISAAYNINRAYGLMDITTITTTTTTTTTTTAAAAITTTTTTMTAEGHGKMAVNSY